MNFISKNQSRFKEFHDVGLHDDLKILWKTFNSVWFDKFVLKLYFHFCGSFGAVAVGNSRLGYTNMEKIIKKYSAGFSRKYTIWHSDNVIRSGNERWGLFLTLILPVPIFYFSCSDPRFQLPVPNFLYSPLRLRSPSSRSRATLVGGENWGTH